MLYYYSSNNQANQSKNKSKIEMPNEKTEMINLLIVISVNRTGSLSFTFIAWLVKHGYTDLK